MSYDTQFIQRQIEHWQQVLAQATEPTQIDRAKKELNHYQQWLQQCQANRKG